MYSSAYTCQPPSSKQGLDVYKSSLRLRLYSTICPRDQQTSAHHEAHKQELSQPANIDHAQSRILANLGQTETLGFLHFLYFHLPTHSPRSECGRPCCHELTLIYLHSLKDINQPHLLYNRHKKSPDSMLITRRVPKKKQIHQIKRE